MIAASSPPVSNASAERTPLLWVVLACVWLLTLNTFSAPGRTGPDSAAALDWLALSKVATRVAALGVLSLLLLRLARSVRWAPVARALLPLGMFALWAVLSALWSPLKAVSIGQAMGLIVQLMLTAALGVLCDRPRRASLVLKHLSWALLAVGLITILNEFLNPTGSSFVRTEIGTPGIVHPTTVGATSSLGILILVAARLMWRWRWASRLLWPGLLIHGPLLILASSRTATALTIVLLMLLVGFYGSRVALAAAIFFGCAAGVVYLTVDADLALAREMLEETGEYASRGDSIENMTTLTGRTALWKAIWREVQKSPLWGHGYFVTSESGELDVWSGGPARLAAHNLFLQVLVSTGLVGLLLFLAGFLLPAARVAAALRPSRGRAGESGERRAESGEPDGATAPGHTRQRGLALRSPLSALDSLAPRPLDGRDEGFQLLGQFLLLFACWFLGWGQLSSSFMGAIQPESVVFFALCGLGLGILRPAPRPAPLQPIPAFARRETIP